MLLEIYWLPTAQVHFVSSRGKLALSSQVKRKELEEVVVQSSSVDEGKITELVQIVCFA